MSSKPASSKPIIVMPDDKPADAKHTDELKFAGFTPVEYYVASTQVQVPHSDYVKTDDPPCGEGLSTSRCKTLFVDIPRGATVTGINLFCKEAGSGTWAPCKPYDRPLGWSRFGQPWQTVNPGNRVVLVEFKNWFGDRNRDARMDVLYKV